MKTKQEAIKSMIDKSESMLGKFAPHSSQHTLLSNRIHALNVAYALLGGSKKQYQGEAYKRAQAPLLSLIHKSEKALMKLKEDTWQFTMLKRNLDALYTANERLFDIISTLYASKER